MASYLKTMAITAPSDKSEVDCTVDGKQVLLFSTPAFVVECKPDEAKTCTQEVSVLQAIADSLKVVTDAEKSGTRCVCMCQCVA